LQTQPAKALTAVTPFLLTALTVVCPAVLTPFTLTVLTFSFKILVAVLIGLNVLVDAVALRDFCLAVLTGTLPDLVKTADGANLF
ncbi:hypothetical protein Tco_0197063, partial [Tanacetum coccineum]